MPYYINKHILRLTRIAITDYFESIVIYIKVGLCANTCLSSQKSLELLADHPKLNLIIENVSHRTI